MVRLFRNDILQWEGVLLCVKGLLGQKLTEYHHNHCRKCVVSYILTKKYARATDKLIHLTAYDFSASKCFWCNMFMMFKLVNGNINIHVYSSPLIRTPLLPGNSVLIRNVSCAEMEHHMHSQYLLERICVLREGPLYMVSAVQINFKMT